MLRERIGTTRRLRTSAPLSVWQLFKVSSVEPCSARWIHDQSPCESFNGRQSVIAILWSVYKQSVIMSTVIVALKDGVHLGYDAHHVVADLIIQDPGRHSSYLNNVFGAVLSST